MQKKAIIISFFISLPVILYLLCLILPTFDDWTYLTAPYFGNPLSADRILPWCGYWRPFDALIGSILGLDFHLFPSLNHALILLAHTISTCLIYRITNKHILPAAFFFLSPAMLGTVLDIDSVNQAYATCWGLISLLLYKKYTILPTHRLGEVVRGAYKWLWMVCVVIATFCKENGIMYAIIPPVICYMREKSLRDVRPYIKDLIPMMALVAVYGIARIMLSPAEGNLKEVYLNATLFDHAKDMVQYLCYTWIPIDYEAIVYPPTRCIPLALLTLLLCLPFLLMLARDLWNRRREKLLYGLVAVYFLAALPHLLTLVSLMHLYAGLPFAAFIIDRCYTCNSSLRRTAIVMFFLAAAITDVHHWYGAYKSGLTGKNLAEEVIRKSNTKPQKVFVLNFDNGEKKYSIINVIPSDAFGWGIAANHYSDYTIANEISDTTITAPSSNAEKDIIIRQVADKKAKELNYDAFWIVDGNNIDVYYEK